MDRNISIPKVFMAEYVAHRGYCTAVRRYEISLRVLKNISRVSVVVFGKRRSFTVLQYCSFGLSCLT